MRLVFVANSNPCTVGQKEPVIARVKSLHENRGEIAPVTHLCQAIYRGYKGHFSLVGSHLVEMLFFNLGFKLGVGWGWYPHLGFTKIGSV